jgi:hypothetical protein
MAFLLQEWDVFNPVIATIYEERGGLTFSCSRQGFFPRWEAVMVAYDEIWKTRSSNIIGNRGNEHIQGSRNASKVSALKDAGIG